MCGAMPFSFKGRGSYVVRVDLLAESGAVAVTQYVFDSDIDVDNDVGVVYGIPEAKAAFRFWSLDRAEAVAEAVSCRFGFKKCRINIIEGLALPYVQPEITKELLDVLVPGKATDRILERLRGLPRALDCSTRRMFEKTGTLHFVVRLV